MATKAELTKEILGLKAIIAGLQKPDFDPMDLIAKSYSTVDPLVLAHIGVFILDEDSGASLVLKGNTIILERLVQILPDMLEEFLYELENNDGFEADPEWENDINKPNDDE